MMNQTKDEGQSAAAGSGPADFSANAGRSSPRSLLSVPRWFRATVERYATAANVLGLALGMYLARLSPAFGDRVNGAVSGFVDAYDIIAPFIVFLVVAPTVGQLIAYRNGRQFISRAMAWLSFNWVVACVWGALFTALIFRLPLLPQDTTGLGEAISISMSSLVYTLTHSKVFLALYAGIAVAIFARRLPRLLALLERYASGLEVAGGYLATVAPLLMLAVGAYIVSLPRTLIGEVDLASNAQQLQQISLLGTQLDSRTPQGMILFYFAISILTGVVTFLWHLSLLARVKLAHRGFSFRHYFNHYWLKINPLLFSTCSESLAAPLNLFLAREHFPEVPAEVRRFSITAGASVDQNGTRINVFLMAGAVAVILGLPLSFTELVMAIPLVILIGLAIPGIPGELVLFAGPLSTLFNVDAATLPVFITLFTGLQFGLPDSFRTCVNSSDRLPVMILLTKYFEAREGAIGEVPEGAAVGALWPATTSAVTVPAAALHPDQPWGSTRPRFHDREVRRIFRNAEALGRLHVALSSPTGDYFRHRVLESLHDAVEDRPPGRLVGDAETNVAKKHIPRELRHGLIPKAELDDNGTPALVRSRLGERALNAIIALVRRIGEQEAAQIMEADLGPNCFRLFLRVYADGGDAVTVGGSDIAYSWDRIGELTLFLPRRIEALAAIEMLLNAGLLVHDDAKDMLVVPSVKARAFYQYLTALWFLLSERRRAGLPATQGTDEISAVDPRPAVAADERAEREDVLA